MFKFETNGAVVMENQQLIINAMISDPKMERKVRKYIRQVMTEARKDAIQNMNLPNDPRHAKQSIRRAIYKKILGANLNILRRKAGEGRTTAFNKPRLLDQNPKMRGGNRVKASERTWKMEHYGPLDRGMILMWLQNGIPGDRIAGTRGGKLHGNRGPLPSMGHPNFEEAAESALNKAADRLSRILEEEIEKGFKKSESQ